MKTIPFLSLQEVTALHADAIREAALRVIDSGWYLQGQENARFERDYAQYIGTRHCVGCANGLDALTLIFRAAIELGKLHPGDEVIVPSNTYIATILAITENGLVPVLCEPRYDTLEIDDALIEPLITPKTRALCIVHLYGRNAYTGRIDELCRTHDLLLVEDNAQAHGCRTADGRVTGSLGWAAGHSFYPGKNLGALGDGGAVTTDDDELASLVRTLANYGSERKYVFGYCGKNSRLDELQAAILDAKLRYLDDDNRHRALIAGYYYDHLRSPLLSLPCRLPEGQSVYHLFPVLVGQGQRDRLQQHLHGQGVGTMIHYPIPPHRQVCYREASWNRSASGLSPMSLPIAEAIADCELSLPIGPTITLEEAAHVVQLIHQLS